MAQFIDSLDPWMEDAAFAAVVHSKQAPSTRFVQVLERRSASVFVLSDKKSRIMCTCTCGEKEVAVPKSIQVGSIVSVDDYKFVVNAKKSSLVLQLETPSIAFAGAQGMGIVGDPVPINDAIQVRRALESIQSDPLVLRKRLNYSEARRTPRLQSRKKGDVMALLRNDDKLNKLMDEEDDDDGNDEEDDDAVETQDMLMTQQFETPVKKSAKKKVKDKTLNRLHVVEDDSEEAKEQPRKKVKKGDALALLGDDDKLDRVLGEGTQEPETQDVAAVRPTGKQNVDDEEDEEYEIALKGSSDEGTRPARRLRGRTMSSNAEPVPFNAAGQGDSDDARLQNQLAAVAEKAREKRQVVDDDDDSSGSEPVGISDMLYPPTQDAPVVSTATQAVPVHSKKRLLVAPTKQAAASKGVRMQRPDFLAAASSRGTSTATQLHSNVSLDHLPSSHVSSSHLSSSYHQRPSDQEYMRRWRKTRSFYERIWEQRNEKAIKFT